MTKLGEFSVEIIKTLAKRAGERCSICNKITSKPHESKAEKFINLGEAAHIKGNKKTPNNRHDGNMLPIEKSNINNAIWLCRSCHKIIDSDSLKYSVEYLTSLKANHENKVKIGYYDNQWQEIETLNVKIAHLEEKISLVDEIKTLQSDTNLQLRIEIESLTKERSELEIKINQLTDLVLSLDLDNPTDNTNKIIDAFRNKDREILNSLLDETKLIDEETELAQKRVIKGVLAELDKDYSQAELNYQKAFNISQSYKHLETYISLLKRKFKYKEAINECYKALEIFTDDVEKARTFGFMAELSADLNKSKDSVHYLHKAIELIKNNESSNIKVFRAHLHSAKGVAEKNIGEFKSALESFQCSLNILWKTHANNGDTEYFNALGTLWNSTGLLYLQNGDIEEALHHFDCAIKIFTDPLYYNKYLLPVVYLNISDIYISAKYFNPKKAYEYLELCHTIVKNEYEKYPLQYLRYYLGCLTKQGSNLIVGQQLEKAKEKFELAIQIANSHTNINLDDELSHIYPNYSILLQLLNQKEEALKYLDLTINLLEKNYEDSEYEINLSLSKLYFQKFELFRNNSFLLKSKEYIAKVPLNPATLKWKAIIEKISIQ
ncbi:hypothetical protein HZP48_00625 [Elizabethkingia anophelis]|nr:hypothetical protein [Elizabethkingia anophelis]MCT4217476.1 hypothetical protein [Elizabethkingia anophelis]